MGDVIEHHRLVNFIARFSVAGTAVNLFLVIGRSGDGFLKDRRIRRHTSQAIFLN